MTEMKSSEKNALPVSADPGQPPTGIPADPEQAKTVQAAESGKLPKQADEKETAANHPPLPAVDAMPMATQPEQSKSSLPMRMIWILSAVVVLLVVLFFIIGRPRQKKDTNKIPDQEPKQEEKSSISDYASVISKNLLIGEPQYSETILTDDAFAGQVPGSVKASGPVISQDIDPQLAALADAFKKRLELLQGSQMVVRGNAQTKITKGEFRGFKINAIEKIENQNVVSSEITVTTPKHGYIKSLDNVLETVKETDFSRFGVEIQDAGLEFFALPAPLAGKAVRMQLRSIRFFGKPIPGELLISGKSVSRITLGMPVAQMEKLFIESHIVLKRKILVNDVYFDVYKILDQSNEPLFYVYENKGKVWGISLISEIFKTEKGIGIGSNLGMMRINYPQIKLNHSEKKTPFVQLEGVDGLFIIQGDGIDFTKKVFPNGNKVISILIGNSPEFE
ncbi:MAG: hypothetical protein MUP71_11560 [Candidatus Aminicenantes bacterium]|nr:hypothetical protein [Candidatus Aminicenantes bacterium]